MIKNNEKLCGACQTKDMTRAKLLAQFVNKTTTSSEKADNKQNARVFIDYRGVVISELL